MNGPENVPADFPGTQGTPAEFKGPEEENAERGALLPFPPLIGPECDDEEEAPVLEVRTEEAGAPVLLPDLLRPPAFEESVTGMFSIFPSSPDFLMSPPV